MEDLLDEKRMESLKLANALTKEAPIDRYLAQLEIAAKVKVDRGGGLQGLHSISNASLQ